MMRTLYSANKLKVYGPKTPGNLVLSDDLGHYHVNNIHESEASIRLGMQSIIDYHIADNKANATVLYDGNTVWPFNKTIRDFKRVLKGNDTSKMTKHLYSFFNLCVGTIAHYDLLNWSNVYPDNQALKDLWARNEYGSPVVRYIPAWKTDAYRIVKEMEKLLKNA